MPPSVATPGGGALIWEERSMNASAAVWGMRQGCSCLIFLVPGISGPVRNPERTPPNDIVWSVPWPQSTGVGQPDVTGVGGWLSVTARSGTVRLVVVAQWNRVQPCEG